MAAGITELNLPDYTIPELFRPSKITIPTRKSISQLPTEDLPAAAVKVATPDHEASTPAVVNGGTTASTPAARAPSPETATNRPVAAVKAAGASYSTALLQQRRGSLPRTTSPEREEHHSDRSASPTWNPTIQKKKLNHNVVSLGLHMHLKVPLTHSRSPSRRVRARSPCARQVLIVH